MSVLGIQRLLGMDVMSRVAIPVIQPLWPKTPVEHGDSVVLHFAGSKKTQEATLPFPKKQRDFSNIRIFSGSSNPRLAKEVVDYLGTHLSKIDLNKFSNRENHVQLKESVRGMDTFIIQS